MEALVMQRKYVRTAFTKTYNTLISNLNETEPNLELVNVSMATLERLAVDLNKFDDQIINLVLEDEEKYEAEYTSIETYKVRLETAKIKVNTYLNEIARKDNTRTELSSYSPRSHRRKLKLPKIELKEFGGDVKDWLSFWSQFKRIHEDPDMEAEDKFQYLIQTMVAGSRAREIVDSFPSSGENYAKAIDV